ncbi:MAG: glycerol-3-phosphate 1-O-acyltransferase PlsY [Dehalococcoidales bacterium]
MIVFQYLAAFVVGYLMGSIPVGVVVSRLTAKVDVRDYGSGMTGTTNVLRTAGRKAAVLVVAGDLLKGALAVVFAGLIVGNGYLQVGAFGLDAGVGRVLAALAAVIGHNWSVFLGFRGGRGVATYFGGMAALVPAVAIFGGEILILSAFSTRFVSLGSIAGVVGSYAIIIPLTLFNGLPIEYMLYSILGVVIIVAMHRGNIVRLMTGKERRLGERVGSIETPPPVEGGG